MGMLEDELDAESRQPGEDINKEFRSIIQRHLDRCRWMNDGRGLLLPPKLAEALREKGIDGPYSVMQPLPAEDPRD